MVIDVTSYLPINLRKQAILTKILSGKDTWASIYYEDAVLRV